MADNRMFISWRCASARPILGVLGGNELRLRHPGFFTAKWRVRSHLWAVASQFYRTSLARGFSLCVWIYGGIVRIQVERAQSKSTETHRLCSQWHAADQGDGSTL